VQYRKDRSSDVYPVYQFPWFPDFPDADNYLTPLFDKKNFIENHYGNPEVQSLLAEEVGTADPTKRQAIIATLQSKLADDLPTIPYLQGAQVAVTGANIGGAQDTLDASFKFRYGVLTKG